VIDVTKKKRKYRKPEPTGINVSPKENYKEYMRQYHIKIRKPRALKERAEKANQKATKK